MLENLGVGFAQVPLHYVENYNVQD
jgi:hypothetical protein